MRSQSYYDRKFEEITSNLDREIRQFSRLKEEVRSSNRTILGDIRGLQQSKENTRSMIEVLDSRMSSGETEIQGLLTSKSNTRAMIQNIEGNL